MMMAMMMANSPYGYGYTRPMGYGYGGRRHHMFNDYDFPARSYRWNPYREYGMRERSPVHYGYGFNPYYNQPMPMYGGYRHHYGYQNPMMNAYGYPMSMMDEMPQRRHHRHHRRHHHHHRRHQDSNEEFNFQNGYPMMPQRRHHRRHHSGENSMEWQQPRWGGYGHRHHGGQNRGMEQFMKNFSPEKYILSMNNFNSGERSHHHRRHHHNGYNNPMSRFMSGGQGPMLFKPSMQRDVVYVDNDDKPTPKPRPGKGERGGYFFVQDLFNYNVAFGAGGAKAK